MLAPYAVHSESSRGRRYAEPEHAYRSAFQRDRDRIVHARAFRRLEDKTQVFTVRYSDHFRTRLTHTIEVAQISRTAAAALHLNEDLAESLALAHDLGHPPFGHSGEKALDERMRARGLAFDHNLQGLRIVEQFEERYADFPGLNLTYEVREGIVKHSHDYNAAEHPELAEYELERRPPLEAQLIDWTDEIAYNTADLDDGRESALLDVEQMRAEVSLFAEAWREASRRAPAAREKLLCNEAIRRVLDRLVGDLIETTSARVKDAGVVSLDELRALPQRLAGLSPAMDAERAQMKDFLYKNLYFSAPLRRQKARGERIVSELFELYCRQPELLPASHRDKAGRGESLERAVCDYIAGMTDTYVVKLHGELTRRPRVTEL